MRSGWFKSTGVWAQETTEIGAKEAASLMSACDLQVDPRNSDVGAGYVTYSNPDSRGIQLVLRTVWWD
jgi:hypothetical protein